MDFVYKCFFWSVECCIVCWILIIFNYNRREILFLFWRKIGNKVWFRVCCWLYLIIIWGIVKCLVNVKIFKWKFCWFLICLVIWVSKGILLGNWCIFLVGWGERMAERVCWVRFGGVAFFKVGGEVRVCVGVFLLML